MPRPRCRLRVARGPAGAEEREDGRPDPLRFLARVGSGWVPDYRAESVCLGAAPIIRLSRNKIARGETDLEYIVVGARDI
jgi:hypothetical protein